MLIFTHIKIVVRVYFYTHQNSSSGVCYSIECYFIFPFTFLAFFLIFHQNFCFYFYFFFDEVSNFRNRILNQTKHLWWITWQKKLTAFSYWLVLQKTPSYLFDRVLNMPLDYLSWLAMVVRYVDTQEGWYVANWL